MNEMFNDSVDVFFFWEGTFDSKRTPTQFSFFFHL